MKNASSKTRARVAQVALPLPSRRTFDYGLTREHGALRKGVRVRVPLQQREVTGVVLALAKESTVPANKLKFVSLVLDEEPLFSSSLLKFLTWAADYYHHPIGDVVKTALPRALRGLRNIRPRLPIRYTLTPAGRVALDSLSKRASVQRDLLQALEKAGSEGLAHGYLLRRLKRSGTAVKRLRERGWIDSHQFTADFLIVAEDKARSVLNESQSRAVKAIRAAGFGYTPFLLHGVTGSGKTEVYLHSAAEIVASGRQVMVLVPEIALTPQLVARFRDGIKGTLAVLHSSLSEQERHIAWWAARQGLADVVIGTRSAVFTPLARPGLYIVDEEHDSSYKQQGGFRYHARDLVVKRAHQEGVPVVLGSATPALESMENLHQGRYRHLPLPQRAGAAAMPIFRLLDLSRLPVRNGMTPPLLKALRLRLERGEQSIVYVNRRGFAPVVLCSACGWQARCDRCDVRLTLHQRSYSLRCHHCGASRPAPEQCLKCGQPTLHHIGEGTQRVEEELRRELQGARILRFDSDSVVSGVQLDENLARVHAGAVDILVGTQLLAKGHHFPAVTLVCILNADDGFYSTDFRAPERLYQQLTQVAGRAGRADRQGEVLVQTRYPENASFARLVVHDFKGFVAAEREQRRAADCPPFKRFVLLRAESPQPEAPLRFIETAARIGHQRLSGVVAENVQLMDPVPSPMERRAGRYRAQLLVIGSSNGPLHRFLNEWLRDLEDLKLAHTVRWSIDVDPIEMY